MANQVGQYCTSNDPYITLMENTLKLAASIINSTSKSTQNFPQFVTLFQNMLQQRPQTHVESVINGNYASMNVINTQSGTQPGTVAISLPYTIILQQQGNIINYSISCFATNGSNSYSGSVVLSGAVSSSAGSSGAGTQNDSYNVFVTRGLGSDALISNDVTCTKADPAATSIRNVLFSTIAAANPRITTNQFANALRNNLRNSVPYLDITVNGNSYAKSGRSSKQNKRVDQNRRAHYYILVSVANGNIKYTISCNNNRIFGGTTKAGERQQRVLSSTQKQNQKGGIQVVNPYIQPHHLENGAFSQTSNGYFKNDVFDDGFYGVGVFDNTNEFDNVETFDGFGTFVDVDTFENANELSQGSNLYGSGASLSGVVCDHVRIMEALNRALGEALTPKEENESANRIAKRIARIMGNNAHIFQQAGVQSADYLVGQGSVILRLLAISGPICNVTITKGQNNTWNYSLTCANFDLEFARLNTNGEFLGFN